MFCPECGYKIDELSNFCESCGYALSAEDLKILSEELYSDVKTVLVDSNEPDSDEVTSNDTDEFDLLEIDNDIDDDLSCYLERIKELETKNRMYRTKCHMLQENLKSLEDSTDEINKLKAENESLKSQISDLTEENTKYQTKLEDILDKVCSLSDSFNACSDNIESIVVSLK